jgi:hypothetical protein
MAPHAEVRRVGGQPPGPGNEHEPQHQRGHSAVAVGDRGRRAERARLDFGGGARPAARHVRAASAGNAHFWEVAVLAVRHAGSQGSAPAETVDLSGEWRDMVAETKDTSAAVTEVLDLASHVDGQGRLAWDAPEGRWTLLRFACLTMGGYEYDVDILSAKAVTAHFEHMAGTILADAGPLAGKTLTHFYNVSWEGASPTWTPGFEQTFTKFRGYDPRPYLPVLAGFSVQGPEMSARFLEDYSRTLSDCFQENCYGLLGELCHRAGLQWHSESGGPVVGAGRRRPERAPGLRDSEARDAEIRRLANELWGNSGEQTFRRPLGKGKIVGGTGVDEALRAEGCLPDFAGPFEYIHRSAEDADIYFVTGKGHADCTFRARGKEPEFWDPVSGWIRDAVHYRTTEDGRTVVPISLPENGAVFVVFRRPAAPRHLVSISGPAEGLEIERRTQGGVQVCLWQGGPLCAPDLCQPEGDRRREASRAHRVQRTLGSAVRTRVGRPGVGRLRPADSLERTPRRRHPVFFRDSRLPEEV